jgi:serine/threonine protein phosphatase PrpC
MEFLTHCCTIGFVDQTAVLGGPGDAPTIAQRAVALALAGRAPDNITELVVLVD